MGIWQLRARAKGYTARQGSAPCHVKTTVILGGKTMSLRPGQWSLPGGGLLSLGQVGPRDRITFFDVDARSVTQN